MGYEAVISALESRDLLRGGWGNTKMALCPAHADERASLSVKEGEDGRALLYCHAGCPTADVVDALGLSMADLFTDHKGSTIADIYVYTDEEGNPLIRVIREEPKGFYQERYEDGEWKPGLREVRRTLYHLPEVVQAVKDGALIYWTEGEKDADALRALGVVATTVLGGAGKWRDEYAESITGARVVLIPDRDDIGRLGAERIRQRLEHLDCEVQVRIPTTGKDVTDHLLAGFGLDELDFEGDELDEFGPLDWADYSEEAVEWLYEPFIPKGARVLAFGSAGSLKSLWAMWVGTKLAKEGKRIAYFALEMLPSDIVSRLKRLNPPRENFMVFTRDFRLGSESHTNKLIAGLKGFDLIVIDSWTAARPGARDSNEAVAALDTEVFLPLIKHTGASLLIIDNTGHDVVTDSGKVKADHARGASAKGDKMEVTLWFRRPFEDNNYRTTITHKKMRLNYPMPAPITVETRQDAIEFFHVANGMLTGTPVWDRTDAKDVGVSSMTTDNDAASAEQPTEPELTPAERRALARLKDKFGVSDEVPEQG